MNELTANRVKFYEFLNGEIPIDELEQWIYENKTLEQEIGSHEFVELLELNFKSHHALPFIQSFVERNFDWMEYEKWRTIKLLEQILEGKIEIVLATRKLRKLYLEQEDKIKNPLISLSLGIGYESVLDECPIETEYHLWDEVALKCQLEQVDSYKESFLKLVSEELDDLLNNVKSIDLSSIQDVKNLHEVFKTTLDFPEFYGRNWDAFWDAITGLVEMPKVLKLKRWNEFERHFKKESGILKEIVNDFNQHSLKCNSESRIEIQP
jgi:RNAse (barnase) inhibitor barstar